jgi:hypothetical protein
MSGVCLFHPQRENVLWCDRNPLNMQIDQEMNKQATRNGE